MWGAKRDSSLLFSYEIAEIREQKLSISNIGRSKHRAKHRAYESLQTLFSALPSTPFHLRSPEP